MTALVVIPIVIASADKSATILSAVTLARRRFTRPAPLLANQVVIGIEHGRDVVVPSIFPEIDRRPAVGLVRASS